MLEGKIYQEEQEKQTWRRQESTASKHHTLRMDSLLLQSWCLPHHHSIFLYPRYQPGLCDLIQKFPYFQFCSQHSIFKMHDMKYMANGQKAVPNLSCFMCVTWQFTD